MGWSINQESRVYIILLSPRDIELLVAFLCSARHRTSPAQRRSTAATWETACVLAIGATVGPARCERMGGQSRLETKLLIKMDQTWRTHKIPAKPWHLALRPRKGQNESVGLRWSPHLRTTARLVSAGPQPLDRGSAPTWHLHPSELRFRSAPRASVWFLSVHQVSLVLFTSTCRDTGHSHVSSSSPDSMRLSCAGSRVLELTLVLPATTSMH